MIIDQKLRALEWEPPASAAARASSAVGAASRVASSLAILLNPPDPASRASRIALPVSLGALAVVATIMAAVLLLRPELEAEPASAMATEADLDTLAVLAEPAITFTTVHLRMSAGLAPDERRRIEAALVKAGYDAIVVHEMPFSISRSRVGYFREADRASAEALIAALRGTLDGIELRDYRKLISTPEPGRLDLWIRS